MESFPTPLELCLTQSQEMFAIRKAACNFSPLASFKAICINLQIQQVSKTYCTGLPYSPPGEHKPAQPLGKLNTSPNKTEKHKQ
jgi:hypothetical protein